MKVLLISVIAIALFNVPLEGKEKSRESRMRIGILDLHTYGEAGKNNREISELTGKYLTRTGLYETYNQEKLNEIINKTGNRMPESIKDPRTVLGIGKIAGMDRMLYGYIEINNNVCGIQMTLIDVIRRRTIEEVSLKGDKLDDIIREAVAYLHGNRTEESKIQAYYGPQVHNEKQFLLTSAGFIGAGLLTGIINYGVEKSNVHKMYARYSSEPLSGMAASADNIPLFARPAALANAYVAISDDAYGVLYNPAGMSWIYGQEASVGYQYRFGINNIAASYVNKATRDMGFGHLFLYSADKQNILTEMYFVSAVSYKFNKLPSFIRPFSLGANLKIATCRVNGSDTGSVSGSSFGAGIDIGLLWELSENIRYGLLLRDIPVINRWKNVTTGYSYFENNAATLNMGGAFYAGYSTVLVAEGQIPLYKDQVFKMAGGIEQELFKVLVIRAGMQKEIMESENTPWKITGGIGFNIKNIAVDGSYEYNTLEVFDVVNISVRYSF